MACAGIRRRSARPMRHGLSGRGIRAAELLADRRESEAAIPQAVDDLGNGGDGLGVRVVHQHDAAARRLPHGPLGDRIAAGVGPVERVDVPHHDRQSDDTTDPLVDVAVGRAQ